jgi:ABC-type amino acid transport substrate-binding protein
VKLLRIIIAWLVVALLFLACSKKENDSEPSTTILRIGTNPNYPPFETIDSVTGEMVGFDIDLMRLICDYNGWTCQFVETGFENLIPSLAAGELDLAISAITIIPERQALVVFSDPYYLGGQTIVVPLDDSTTNDIEDLHGKRVGVQAGTIGDKMARAINGVHVFPFDDITVAFGDLAVGKLDAVVNDYPMTRVYIDMHGGLRTISATLNAEYYGIAVPMGQTDLLTLIDSTLAIFAGNNTHENLHLKWFGYPLLDIPGVDTTGTGGR